MNPLIFTRHIIIICLIVGWSISTSDIQAQTLEENWWIANSHVNCVEEDVVNNRIYLGGDFDHVGPVVPFGISVDAVTGLPDLSFPEPNSTVNSVVPDGSGGWYIGGSFIELGGVARYHLARINSDGTLHTWNPATNGVVLAMALEGNTLYIGGNFSYADGQSRNHLASFDLTTGDLTTWDPNANNLVSALAIDGTTVYVGGYFNSVDGQTRNKIAAVDATTGTVSLWDPDASGGDVLAIVVDNGIVYAGGNFSDIGGQSRSNLAALDASTGLATTWDPSPSNRVEALAFKSNTIYAGGHFSSIGGQSRNYIAAVDASNGLATSWDPNANKRVLTLLIEGNMVYVGGSFTQISGQARTRLAAIDLTTSNANTWDPKAGNDVYAIASDGSNIYLGGSFRSIGGVVRNRIVSLDATTGQATSWDPDADGPVWDIVVDGGTIYAGGFFSNIGGDSRNRIAALDPTTGIASSWNPNGNSGVNIIIIDGSHAFVAGSFSSIGGMARNRLAQLDLTTGLATSWNPNANGGVYAMDIEGSLVYVGGAFGNVGGEPRNKLAAIDKVTGLANLWNPNPNDQISALDVANGLVYIGGRFTSVGGESRNYIAAIEESTGNATSWNPDASNRVNFIREHEDVLYTGGWFTSIGGQLRGGFAVLEVATGNSTTWDPGADWELRDIVVSENNLYAGGSFVNVAGQSRQGFAVFSEESATTSPVTTLATLTDQCPSGTLSIPVTVSNFTDIGGISLVMDYDDAELDLTGVTWNASLPGALDQEPSPGKLTFSWFSTTGVDLADDDVLFTLDFDYIGGDVCSTPVTLDLTWDNSDGTYLEYSSPDGTILPDEPFEDHYINGSLTIEDNTPPVITTCPPTLDVEGCSTDDLTSDGQTTLAYSDVDLEVTEGQFIGEGGVVTDNCSDAMTYTYADFSTGTNPVVVTRTWTITDECDNSITCDQTININDNTPPVIDCPTLDAAYVINDNCNWFATGIEPVISDNCSVEPELELSYSTDGGSTWTPGDANGHGFEIGDTELIYKLIDEALNEVSCTLNVHVDGITLTGDVTYYNTDNTSMGDDVTIILQQGGTDIHTTTTTAGVYTFEDVCLETFDIVASTTLNTGSINSTDAAQVNYWAANNSSIQQVRFYAGDVVGADFKVLSNDAGLIQQYFLTLGNPSPAFTSDWTFWTVDEMIGANPGTGGYPQVTVNNAASTMTQNLYGMVNGDFNRSYTPGSYKSSVENLMLSYGDNLQVGSEAFELALRAGLNMEVGAISLIINIPDELDVEDVYLSNDPNQQLLYSIIDKKLRISWLSMNPINLQQGESLLTLLMSLNEVTSNEGIEITLASDPLNELADDTYQVMDNAELVVDVIVPMVTGTEQLAISGDLSLMAHPNPFRETTNLVYTLPTPGKVTLEVYNLHGSKVRTVVEKSQEMGDHQVRFDAYDLQPGVYTVMIRLETQGATLTHAIKIVSR